MDHWNDKINNLSGGQKQRIALLKVLGKDNDVLILDEPTVGLDEKGADTLMSYLSRTKKKQNHSRGQPRLQNRNDFVYLESELEKRNELRPVSQIRTFSAFVSFMTREVPIIPLGGFGCDCKPRPERYRRQTIDGEILAVSSNSIIANGCLATFN